MSKSPPEQGPTIESARPEEDAALGIAFDAHVTFDVRGSVLDLNAAAERTFGHRRGDVLGRHITELVLPRRSISVYRPACDRLLADGDRPLPSRPLGLIAARADGREFPAALSLAKTRQTPPRFSAWIRDLSSCSAAAEAARGADAVLVSAEREVAAHLAVVDALTAWQSLEQGAERLLRELARALDLAGGALWLRDGDVLVPRVFWNVPPHEPSELERANRSLRLRKGQGLPGRVWERATIEPDALSAQHCFLRGAAASHDGIHAAIALPAIVGEKVTGVLELYSKESLDVGEPLMRLFEWIGPRLGPLLARSWTSDPPELTRREREILRLAADGHSTRELAELLVVSPSTVKTHLHNIYRKLGVRDRAGAVARALRTSVID
jgi:PAS domain S-box-containing protein